MRETLPRVALVRPSKLLWVPIVTAAVFFIGMIGTPHVLVTYRYVGTTILECSYAGRGWHNVPPVAGECPFIRFFGPEK